MSTYTATKARLLRECDEVYELEGDVGFLVKRGGKWLVLDARGQVR